MKLLALDTASAQCSVALLLGDELIVRAEPTAREHARLILPMVEAVLREAGMQLAQLDGIAFGRGPGSFTGVRVAASVTQGLAAGAGLPVLPVSDLRALSAQAVHRIRADGTTMVTGTVLACMDARMGEVYWCAHAVADGGFDALTAEQVSAADVLQAQIPRPCVAAAGLGLAAWPQIAESLQLAGDRVFATAEPHAREIARLAACDLDAGAVWLDAALALPVYIRDQVAVAKVQI